MTIILAEDDPVSRKVATLTVERWGLTPLVAETGDAAWALIEAQPGAVLAILDWMMPGLDGPEICRRVRATPHLSGSYILLLTARSTREDIVAGLDAGADDFVTKPFDRRELHARVQVGQRILRLQRELRDRVTELQATRATMAKLEGMLPICAHCKRIRDQAGRWEQVEDVVQRHSCAEFTHGICPDCLREQLCSPAT